MTANLLRYNADVIATSCTVCGAAFPERCRTTQGSAHHTRIHDAGYQWCRRHKALERLTDPGKCDTNGQAGKGRKPGAKNNTTT